MKKIFILFLVLLLTSCRENLHINYGVSSISNYQYNKIFIQRGYEVDIETFLHEYGHFVDYNYIKSWENKEFTKVLKNEKVYNIIDNIWVKDIFLGTGHSKMYWSFTGNREKEAFANLFMLYTVNDIEAIHYIHDNHIKVEEIFFKILQENGIK